MDWKGSKDNDLKHLAGHGGVGEEAEIHSDSRLPRLPEEMG
jgi:hypothetical protein